MNHAAKELGAIEGPNPRIHPIIPVSVIILCPRENNIDLETCHTEIKLK